jgi:hypothetical protein
VATARREARRQTSRTVRRTARVLRGPVRLDSATRCGRGSSSDAPAETSGEAGGAEQHHGQDADQGEWVPVDLPADQPGERVDDGGLRKARTPADTALPSTNAARGIGLTRTLCTMPRSHSQITAMP